MENHVNGKSVDNDNFNSQTDEQESKVAGFVRPVKLPDKSEPKASQFVTGDGEPIDIVEVKRLGTVAVRRPKKSEWFRCHPEMTAELFIIQRDDAHYAVRPDVAAELGDEVRMAYIVPAINDDGALFLWPILKPKADGNGTQLFDQALEDLSLSRTSWVRRQWDSGAKTYRVAQAKTDKQPNWPDNTNIVDWIEKAFKNSFIEDLEHPIIRKLRGELL